MSVKTFYKLIRMALALMLLAMAAENAMAQNLTAAQNNIYFGQPKRATITNSQGTIISDYDQSGRIMSVTQGVMRMVYDWNDDGSKLTISVYRGQDLQDSGVITISEMTKTCYKYNVNGMQDVIVTFKDNGALDKFTISTPEISSGMAYLYRNQSDIYPYAIEMSMGEQTARASVTINQTDSYGNATEFTQELMGQKEVTHVAIQYY